jgi:hypothetical protein
MRLPNHHTASFTTGGAAAGEIRAKKRRSSGAPPSLPAFREKRLSGYSSFHPDYITVNLQSKK